MPRAGLSTAAVVCGAAELVDELGADRLTLSELAKRFGVAQPSLYKHVDGLAGLHRLLAVRACAELADALRRAATGRAGADACRAVAAAYRDYATAHPGCYAYLIRAPAPDDEELAAAAGEVMAVLLDVFTGYGLGGDDAVDAARFVRSTLHGFVAIELGGGFAIPVSTDRSFARLVAATDRALATWEHR